MLLFTVLFSNFLALFKYLSILLTNIFLIYPKHIDIEVLPIRLCIEIEISLLNYKSIIETRSRDVTVLPCGLWTRQTKRHGTVCSRITSVVI